MMKSDQWGHQLLAGQLPFYLRRTNGSGSNVNGLHRVLTAQPVVAQLLLLMPRSSDSVDACMALLIGLARKTMPSATSSGPTRRLTGVLSSRKPTTRSLSGALLMSGVST